MNTAIEPKNFKRKDISQIILTTLVVSVCLYKFIRGDWVFGLLFLVISIWAFRLLYWSISTPYVKVTNEGITVFPAHQLRPETAQWDNIQKFNQLGNKLELLLSDDKQIQILLSRMYKKDSDSLIEIIKNVIQ